jgi:hypothetical protein
MLGAALEGAERKGFTVKGFAPSATAARVLQQGCWHPIGYTMIVVRLLLA